jgi:outer membrane protein assembly factor BamE (lipoprotein component of BamABCDE complex)
VADKNLEISTMKPTRFQKKVMLGLALLISLAGLLMLFVIKVNKVLEPDYKRLEVIQVGMTEAEVIQILGPPHKIFRKETAPKDYYVSGWSYKKRDITNKVLIYSFGEPIAYYYLDENNKVEDIYIGGS